MPRTEYFSILAIGTGLMIVVLIVQIRSFCSPSYCKMIVNELSAALVLPSLSISLRTFVNAVTDFGSPNSSNV